MLNLTIRDDEYIQIGPDVRVYARPLSMSQTRVAIEAPRDVKILRSDLVEREMRERLEKKARR